jgi:hypothetical protein
MKTNVRSTAISQSNQTKADSPEKVPAFRLQTGVRAGGFYENFYSAWGSASEDFNQADKAAGHI